MENSFFNDQLENGAKEHGVYVEMVYRFYLILVETPARQNIVCHGPKILN